MKSIVAQLAALLALTVACVAGTNSPSYLLATNEADFVRFMKINQQRTQKGLKPFPIQLSPQLDKKLVSDGTLPSPDEEPQSVSLLFKNAPLSFVLEKYTALTGKTVLIEERLSLPVTIATDKPVSKAEAVALIEKALSLKGIILTSVDKKTVKAVRKPKEEEAQPSPGHVRK
jgi:type II secretory pathway component GspD/PulD (secretin)